MFLCSEKQDPNMGFCDSIVKCRKISVNIYSVPTTEKAPSGNRSVYNIISDSENYNIKGEIRHKL